MSSRITLFDLTVEGPGKVPASVSFKPGLNAIVGATGTGKSYIFQAIDFCTGAGKQPKTTTQGVGYTHASLTLGTDSGQTFVLQRDFSGGKIILTAVDGRAVAPDRTALSAKHSDNNESLSWWLLTLLGLQGIKIINNAWRERKSFTFRHVAHLAMVDENRIISEESPAVTGGPRDSNRTSDQRAFNVLITGQGDDPVERPVTKKKDRNLSIDGKIEWITGEIQRLQHLQSQVALEEGESIESRLTSIDQSIETSTTITTATKMRVTALEAQRQESRKALIAASDTKDGITERLKQFAVLRQFYDTDVNRIEATLEAGHAFEKLPGGQCAVCGMPTDHSIVHTATQNFHEYARAAQSELSKLIRLKLDLDETMKFLDLDLLECEGREQNARQTLETIEHEIQFVLKPQVETTAEQLKQSVRTRAELERALDTNNSIERLKTERLTLEKEKKRAVSKPPRPEKVAPGSIQGFCKIVQNTLESWKFDLESEIEFDERAFDLIINGQARSSLGKGHRALTNAAFIVSIMRYCQEVGLPHPGFVVLDSPLNPFKGKTTKDGGETHVSREVQDAFYTDLAKRPSTEQYIIIENTEVPLSIFPMINHVGFSGNPEQPRAGFFPPIPSGI
jgi:hypothetical protein